MDLYIAVVLYNQKISEIVSLANFLKLKKTYKNLYLLVFDNSNKDISYLNTEMYHNYYQDLIIYHSNSGNNIGLSKNYNKAIDYIRNHSDDWWLMLADDDTTFSMQYLENCIEAANGGKCDLITGVIKGISPVAHSKIKFDQSDYIINPGVYKNIYCINSGLWIHSKIFDVIGKYDERLFLDMVDYWFMDVCKEHDVNKVLVVSGKVTQDFSGNSFGSLRGSMIRYKIYRKDFKYYCKRMHTGLLFEYGTLIKRLSNIIIRTLIHK